MLYLGNQIKIHKETLHKQQNHLDHLINNKLYQINQAIINTITNPAFTEIAKKETIYAFNIYNENKCMLRM